MKKLTFLFLFLPVLLNAQDIIYTVSGNYNGGKTSLDSIIVDNITNGTSISFGDLPEQDYYQINLTKNAYWTTVSVVDIEEPSIFTVQQNTSGFLSILYGGAVETNTRISVININGQIHHSKDLILSPHNLIKVKLGSNGVYLVRIESTLATKTFKTIGGGHSTGFVVEISDGDGIDSNNYRRNIDSNLKSTLKNGLITEFGNFRFTDGDSIRVWAFRKDIYAWPNYLKIEKSDNIEFIFKDVVYADEMEMAYPDSVGELLSFTLNEDTLFYEKINNEFIFQGDIILTEEQINLNKLKGAATNDLVKLWPDGKVFYTVSPPLDKNDVRIMEAIKYWNENTPINLVRRTTESNYIDFIWDTVTCSSFLGMKGGRQEIKIPGWAKSGSIMHEIGHAVGLIHEHTKSNRKKYIIVDTKGKVIPQKEHNYYIFPNSVNSGTLDTNSIMIYGCFISQKWAVQNFDYKNIPVMTMIDGSSTWKVQRSYLSISDLEIIEILYGRKFIDERDGHVYRWVKIGEQIWMAENLAYFPSHSLTMENWDKPQYHVYKDDESSSIEEIKNTNNYITYGVLYNWPAAPTACPRGWHLPTDDEWKQLEITIGMSQSEANKTGVRGLDEGAKLKAISGGWIRNSGTDDYGFSALPSGYWEINISYYGLGSMCYWWTSTEFSPEYVWVRRLRITHNSVERNYFSGKVNLRWNSIRCIKD